MRPLPVRSCRNLGSRGARQRPQPGAGATGGDHGPEVLDAQTWPNPRACLGWARDDLRRRAGRASCARDPGRPLVTFYDDATGERVELSVTTYANWVAKTASLLVEEHDLERGQRLRVDLPTHWLGPVFLGAAWTVGLVVGPTTSADAVVCGPGRPRDAGRRWPTSCRCWPARCGRWGCGSPSRCRRACTTSAIEVWSQPDAFIAWDPPRPTTTRRRSTGRHPGRAVESGRRRESPHRRRPPPLGGEPGFPTGDRLLHRAARTRRLAGPGRPRRTGAARGDVRRRARHGSLPLTWARAVTGSAGQVVGPHPFAEEAPRPKPVAVPGSRQR